MLAIKAPGTDYAKGQTYCIVIDMKHPEIAGVAPVLVNTPPPPANDLKEVS